MVMRETANQVPAAPPQRLPRNRADSGQPAAMPPKSTQPSAPSRRPHWTAFRRQSFRTAVW